MLTSLQTKGRIYLLCVTHHGGRTHTRPFTIPTNTGGNHLTLINEHNTYIFGEPRQSCRSYSTVTSLQKIGNPRSSTKGGRQQLFNSPLHLRPQSLPKRELKGRGIGRIKTVTNFTDFLQPS